MARLLLHVDLGWTLNLQAGHFRPQFHRLCPLPIQRGDRNRILTTEAVSEIIQKWRNRYGIRQSLKVSMATSFLADFQEPGLAKLVVNPLRP